MWYKKIVIKKNLFELPILSDYNLHFYHEKDK